MRIGRSTRACATASCSPRWDPPIPGRSTAQGARTRLTSKVAIAGRCATHDVDVEYLFAQVLTEQAIVDLNPTCGNILAGVGPFAIERGMVEAADGETRVRILMVNTGGLVKAVVQTPGRVVRYDGDVAIDGVPGTSAPVFLNLLRCAGSKTGAMLPSGKPRDEIDGVPVTLIDVAMPMMVVRADSLGKTGYETPAELDADTAFLARVERMRRTAGELMGMGDVSGMVVPKVSLVAPPKKPLRCLVALPGADSSVPGARCDRRDLRRQRGGGTGHRGLGGRTDRRGVEAPRCRRRAPGGTDRSHPRDPSRG